MNRLKAAGVKNPGRDAALTAVEYGKASGGSGFSDIEGGKRVGKKGRQCRFGEESGGAPSQLSGYTDTLQVGGAGELDDRWVPVCFTVGMPRPAKELRAAGLESMSS
jgi:hypothetical protein